MMQIEAALTEHGVSPEDIDKAKSYQARAGGSLEKILLNMGAINSRAARCVAATGALRGTADRIFAKK